MGRAICWRELEPDSRIYFLQAFRQARLVAQKDTEAFDELLFAFERLGCFRLRQAATLGCYRDPLIALANRAWLGGDLSAPLADWHTNLSTLYLLVSHARNDAFHQGAVARHLTEHAIELALLFEDAFMNGRDNPMTKLQEIMVRSPVIAEPWQPVSFVRQVMLTNSFSTLPIYFPDKKKWQVITDAQVAAFLRSTSVTDDRSVRLGKTVKEAAAEWPLVSEAVIETPDTLITKIAERFADKPFVLVLAEGKNTDPQSKELLGIVTAFDIL